MLTGDQYRQSIRDGRASYFEGQLVSDAAKHPLIGQSVDWVAKTYDRHCSTAKGAHNPLYDLPKTTDELQALMDLLMQSDLTVASTAGVMALQSVGDEIASVRKEYRQRLDAFLAGLRDQDHRVAVAEDDLGSPVEVVSRTAEGVTLRGSKQHVVGGAVVHELFVVPAGKASRSETAIACAIPVNAKGLKLVSTTTSPRGHDTRHFPYSRDHSMADSIVILEDVFVPNDRIFLDGEVESSTLLTDTLGVWDRARSTAQQADQAEILLGLARTIAEMNGVADASHIKDKLATMAVYARLCRAGWEASLNHAHSTASGMIVPDDSFIYATRAYGVTNYSEMAGWVHDIGGALILTAPTVADYENEATHMYVEKYMSTGATVRGEDRMRIFHLIRDLTADKYSGWAKISNQMVGGGLFAQKEAALEHYDLEPAKAKARETAHIKN